MLTEQVSYLEVNNGYVDKKTGQLHGYPTAPLPDGKDDLASKAASVITHHLLKNPAMGLSKVFIPLS